MSTSRPGDSGPRSTARPRSTEGHRTTGRQHRWTRRVARSLRLGEREKPIRDDEVADKQIADRYESARGRAGPSPWRDEAKITSARTGQAPRGERTTTPPSKRAIASNMTTPGGQIDTGHEQDHPSPSEAAPNNRRPRLGSLVVVERGRDTRLAWATSVASEDGKEQAETAAIRAGVPRAPRDPQAMGSNTGSAVVDRFERGWRSHGSAPARLHLEASS